MMTVFAEMIFIGLAWFGGAMAIKFVKYFLS
jgi:hypothetical protein